MKKGLLKTSLLFLSLIVFTILTGCSYDQTSIAIPDGTNPNVQVTGQVWNPHAGEYVDLDGMILVSSHETNDGTETKLHINFQGLAGTGSTSQKKYRVVGAGNSSNGTLTVSTDSFIGPVYTTTVHLVGNNNNFEAPVNLLVFETDGELSVTIDPIQ